MSIKESLGDQLEKNIMDFRSQTIEKRSYRLISGVWNIRHLLPITDEYVEDSTYDVKEDDPLTIPLLGGGKMDLGLFRNPGETDDDKLKMHMTIDLKHPSVRCGDCELVERCVFVVNGIKTSFKDKQFLVHWNDSDDPALLKTMNFLATLDPERDIDWESITPGSLEDKVAKSMCDFEEN